MKKKKQNGKEQTEKPQTSNNKVKGEEQDGELLRAGILEDNKKRLG
jgi:hypothetical protein